MALHPQLDTLINTMLPFVQQFHARGQMAPHAASMNHADEITGSALTTDNEHHLSVDEAIAHFEAKFRVNATSKDIAASAIFFHGIGIGIDNPAKAATTEQEAQAIIALLEHKNGDSVFLVVPYINTASGIVYEMGKLVNKPVTVFLPAQKSTRPWWRFW